MGKLERITVGLPAEQMALLRQAVQTGHYETEDDVIAEALLEWHARNIAPQDPLAVQLGDLWDAGKADGAAAPYSLAEVLDQARRNDASRS
jgi:Arc/MetJ-type ribon-helix-helix transcriptional regulator